MTINLQLKSQPNHSVDARQLSPRILCGLSQTEIENLPIGRNPSEILIGDLFDVSCSGTMKPCDKDCPSYHDCHSNLLILNGDLSSFHRIGQNMDSGRLWINGHVGSEFASGMNGGVCVVAGNASDHAAQAFRGGLLAICGHCGDDLASPMPGKKCGMTGGDILIGGNIGDRVALRMRRGTIFIAGHAGHHGCQQMIAGTVVVNGNRGERWCIGMKRGSLIELAPGDMQSATHAGFSVQRQFELSFLQILWRHLRTQHKQLAVMAQEIEAAFPFRPPVFPQTNWVARQVGDTLVSGQGEWLRVSTPGLR